MVPRPFAEGTFREVHPAGGVGRRTTWRPLSSFSSPGLMFSFSTFLFPFLSDKNGVFLVGRGGVRRERRGR